MAIITHSYRDKRIQKAIPDIDGFLLSNKQGGYLSLAMEGNRSRYQGLHTAELAAGGWDLFKSIDSVRLDAKAPTEIINRLITVERVTEQAVERFYFNHSNALLYEVENFTGNAELRLDCRKIYDFDDKGRIYSIRAEGPFIIIEYKKFSDASLANVQYAKCIAIRGLKAFTKVEQWEKVSYPFDKRRESTPDELWIFNALKIKIEGSAKIVFAVGDSVQQVKNIADSLYNHSGYLMAVDEKYTQVLTRTRLNIPNSIVYMAYVNALKSLDGLIMHIGDYKGIYAGLWWFFQFWTRDEAISLNAITMEDRFHEAKAILMRQLHSLHGNGRMPNRFPSSELGSADGTGWVFRRFLDLIIVLEKKNLLDRYFSQKDLDYLEHHLEFAIMSTLKHHTSEGFIINQAKETWMDTEADGDVRKGARIEIQALLLVMYQLMQKVCLLQGKRDKAAEYSKRENDFARIIKIAFYKDGWLADGWDTGIDSTIRPNVFIAAYLYPDLLSKYEWSKVIDNILPFIWLDWGGLATIDKRSPLFKGQYTGQDNRSYHRGDSWYFLNSMAAIVMQRIDKQKYDEHIKRILFASCEDILYKGLAGHHSEISSAQLQTAEAALCQAWSAAMFIELMHEIYV